MTSTNNMKLSIFLVLQLILVASGNENEKWSWGKPNTSDKKAKALDSGTDIKSHPLDDTLLLPEHKLAQFNDTDPRFLDFKPKLCKLGFEKYCEQEVIAVASSYTSYVPNDPRASASLQHPTGKQFPGVIPNLIVPTQTVVHHEHIHTHIHSGSPNIIPNTIQQLNHIPNSHQKPIIGHLPTHRPEIIKPISQIRPSVYRESCQCVPRHFCDQIDIIPSNSHNDVSAIINPRSRNTTILSNSTGTVIEDVAQTVKDEPTTPFSVRNKRDILIKHHQFDECRKELVCCRRPKLESEGRQETQCGRGGSAIHGRITKHQFQSGDTQFGQYPWQVAILKREFQNARPEYVCGGTLIDQFYVLTAAHCIHGISSGSLVTLVGEWDAGRDTEFYPSFEIKTGGVVIHPGYDGGNLANDIAIIRLIKPVDFHNNPHIQPVCLPRKRADFTNQRCVVTGWGKDAFGNSGNFQNILKQVQVPIVDRRLCERSLQQTRLGFSYRLSQGMVCAGGEKDKDACKGDGGGPLVCRTSDGSFELAGLVSWGIGCGNPGIPGVYVDVPYYIDWINAVTRI